MKYTSHIETSKRKQKKKRRMSMDAKLVLQIIIAVAEVLIKKSGK